jgi:hypothetical protein
MCITLILPIYINMKRASKEPPSHGKVAKLLNCLLIKIITGPEKLVAHVANTVGVGEHLP